MSDERFLVTGALGCIGAWVVKQLVESGVAVWTYDLPGKPHRLRLILDDASLGQVRLIEGDITDFARFDRAVEEHGITHIVHLAALQVPFVAADPVKGAAVNVVGTTVVLESARRHADQVQGVAYASSVGVYGPPERYPVEPLAYEAPALPTTLYGVFKHANEETARIFWQDHGVHSVGLRPAYVYGPGRDQGMTSTPTKAMVAAVIGKPYRISFGGVNLFQHAEDVAALFVKAARARVPEAPVFTLGGTTRSMADLVAAIEAVAPEATGSIAFEDRQLPFPYAVDTSRLEGTLGPVPDRELVDGVRQTISCFREAIAAGRLDAERAMGA